MIIRGLYLFWYQQISNFVALFHCRTHRGWHGSHEVDKNTNFQCTCLHLGSFFRVRVRIDNLSMQNTEIFVLFCFLCFVFFFFYGNEISSPKTNVSFQNRTRKLPHRSPFLKRAVKMVWSFELSRSS